MDCRVTLHMLNQEWDRLAQVTQITEWVLQEPALAGATDLTDLLPLIRSAPDATLSALLRLGSAGEPVAFRVVFQSMLGMLARRCRHQPELLEEAVSELWLLIAEYPLQRRPHAIAANLAWGLRRRLQPPAPPAPPLIEPAPRSAAATLSEARELGLIDPQTHQTLWTVYVAGLTSQQAATQLGSSPTAIRWRCSRALRQLAEHAELLAA